MCKLLTKKVISVFKNLLQFKVTKNGDLFGDLILLSRIKVVSRYENYAKYGEKTAKKYVKLHFKYLANPTSGRDISS